MHRSRSSSRENLDQQRTHYIVETFLRNFGDEMKKNPKGWRGRFRKMVANEFAFYRGSAVLFYRDMLEDLPHDRWLKKCPQASRVFIHGDLHAENFGTYIDLYGLINFDVNDFDEGYIGPFTWDVKRLLASINLIAYRKAFSDKKIARVLECLLRAYLDQIDVYCRSNDSYYMAITSENTEGAVNKLLKESRLGSKEAHLNSMTTVENYERKFCRSKTVKDVDDQTREQVLAAFDRYVQTIPEHEKKSHKTNFQVKDIVARTSPGIGSAGRISYNLLLQGSSQALESDVILFMKPATRSAVATVSTDREVDQAFQHDGLRTVLCCYAMHAVTSKWLGYTTFNQMPMLVDEVATHSQDFDWENVNDFREMAQTAEYLGKAMAKIHCVADMDSIEKMRHVRHHTDLLPAHIIPRHTERTLRDAIGQNNDEFINEMISFAMFYGRVVRRDHALFFEAFRNEQIPIIDQFQNPVDSVKPGHIH